MIRRSRRAELVPLLLIWLAFGLRIYRLGFQSLWRDEVDTLRFATRALPDLLATFRQPGENGPLFFLALRPWVAVAGQSEFSLRFPSALAGALAVAVTYALARRLAGRRTALVIGLLMATGPYLVWYGQEAKMYAALTALVSLSLLLTWEACRRGGWWRWVLLYAVTSLGFYFHLLAALVVPVQAVWFLILLRSRRRSGDRQGARVETSRRDVSTDRAAVVYLVLLVLPYLPLAWWEAQIWLSPTFQTGHPFVLLPDIYRVLAADFSRGVLPGKEPLSLVPFMLALVSGVAFGLPNTGLPVHWSASLSNTGLWLTWLLLPPLAVYGISLGMPIFLDRYLIWVMPAFLALVGIGVTGLARIWRPLGWTLLGVILAFNLADVWAQAHQPFKADFRAAAQFVAAHQQPGDLLIFQIPYNRYTFSYYFGQDFRWLDGPYTNGGMNETALAATMADGTAGAPAAWLIASEVPMWDERDLAEAWLVAHGAVTDRADFTRVSVTRYQFRDQESGVSYQLAPADD